MEHNKMGSDVVTITHQPYCGYVVSLFRSAFYGGY